MKRKATRDVIFGGILLAVFLLYTLSLTFVDVRPIGPNNSSVAFATINGAIHELFGIHMSLFIITDWASLIALFIIIVFAVLGLVQWVRRKSIRKVDSSILVLGIFYILVFAVYLFFEFVVINCRPVLINGYLEASYPSSTTMLAMCVLPTAMMQFHRRIKNRKLRTAVNAFLGLYTAFLVIGRLAAGVHWVTDILGGAIFSTSMILFYCGVNNYIEPLIRE